MYKPMWPKKKDSRVTYYCGKCGKFLVKGYPGDRVFCHECDLWSDESGVVGQHKHRNAMKEAVSNV